MFTNSLADWLVEELSIDGASFSGMTHIRGDQADFDLMGWEAFRDMLRRSRRACKHDPDKMGDGIARRYADVAAKLTANRARFAALEAAIDRVVWQLVGLKPDGSL